MLDISSILHRYEPGRPHWWQWLTVLSLDAPVVAVAWQVALARTARCPFHWYHGFILGAAVWLAYAADRWIEGWRLPPRQVLTQRHWFYQQWRWPVAAVWVAVLIVALGLAVTQLTRAELIAGLVLLVPVLIYLLSHQLVHRTHPWRAPKEICVALLFTAGVACFLAADEPVILNEIAGPLLCFGLLCFADCALISIWEDGVDRSHGQTSLALQFPQGRPFVRALPWIIAILGVVYAFQGHPKRADIIWCAVAGGALLGGVDLVQPWLGRQLSRTLADVTLMTPLVLLLVGHFQRT
jgi:hypothetical protein